MKEQENLEQYIRRYRWELDEVEEPRKEAMWEELDRRLSSGWRLTVGRNWLWTAAAGVALIIGVYSMIRLQAGGAPQINKPVLALSHYYPELAGEERRYQQLVAEKEEAVGLRELRPADYESIFEELRLLDEIHAQYLRDLPRFYENEQLVQTLLKYYEQKMRILERLSLEIEKKKHHEERIRDQRLL